MEKIRRESTRGSRNIRNTIRKISCRNDVNFVEKD